MKHVVIALIAFLSLAPLRGERVAAGRVRGATDLEEQRTTLRLHALKLINRDRAHFNLPPVELDPHASRIGDEYCLQQIRDKSTGHYGTNGWSPYMRYSFGGGNDGISENAAAWSANYVFSERALYEIVRRSQDAMMGEMPPDDGHRRVILDPHATHVGIGLAWERGEFRMVHEFVRRYVDWTRAIPRDALADERVIVAGRPLDGASIAGITVHHEPMPRALTASAASAHQTYSLPRNRKEYTPRMRRDGTFHFTVPFTEGAGVYTVVVWVSKDGAERAIAASNVAIRVEERLQSSGASAVGR